MRLRELCEDEGKAIKTYGVNVAERLFSRLADIMAADDASQLVLGNLRWENRSELAIDLSDGYTLVMTENAGRSVKRSYSEDDFAGISSLQIQSITRSDRI